MKISVIGAGYVGLVTAACLAEIGHKVECLDINKDRINALKKAKIPIFEPGLDQIVEKNLSNKRLNFSTDLKKTIPKTDVIFVAVGTPTNEKDGSADLSYVFGLARDIAPLIKQNTVIIIKSTVPVGTGAKFRQVITSVNPKAKFHMVSKPEFLREGSAVNDFMQTERIIVGSESSYGSETVKKMYKKFYDEKVPFVFTDIKTSELIKYAANGFLATKIAFINEISDLCEKSGANITDLVRGIGLDTRIGAKFLNPGPGFGGSCFPKDTLALRKTAIDNRAPLSIINSVINANDSRKKNMAKRIADIIDAPLKGKKIAVLGLAFKGNTDDIRESPAIEIVQNLIKQGAKIQAFDPKAMPESAKIIKSNIKFCNDEYEAANSAEALVILTEWEQFRDLDLELTKSLLKQPVVIDLRNMLNPEDAKKAKLNYYPIGKKPIIFS